MWRREPLGQTRGREEREEHGREVAQPFDRPTTLLQSPAKLSAPIATSMAGDPVSPTIKPGECGNRDQEEAARPNRAVASGEQGSFVVDVFDDIEQAGGVEPTGGGHRRAFDAKERSPGSPLSRDLQVRYEGIATRRLHPAGQRFGQDRAAAAAHLKETRRPSRLARSNPPPQEVAEDSRAPAWPEMADFPLRLRSGGMRGIGSVRGRSSVPYDHARPAGLLPATTARVRPLAWSGDGAADGTPDGRPGRSLAGAHGFPSRRVRPGSRSSGSSASKLTALSIRNNGRFCTSV